MAINITSCGNTGKSRSPIIAEVFNSDLEYPNGVPLFITTLNLNEPALLTSTTKNKDGSLTVNQNLKEAIILEQEQMIEKLKSISPEIKVIYSYKLALNALTIEAPQKFANEISELNVKSIAPESFFKSPSVIAQKLKTNKDLIKTSDRSVDITKNNSVTYIGAHKVHNKLKTINKSGIITPVKGQGIKVGVIDTGIDYTHKALGGSGNVNEFNKIDDSVKSAAFPNNKVVGGYDFVGADFGAQPHLYRSYVPIPDENPLDKSGHGTHVAGTVAGKGDGINTYDGVAPEAELYALKVFGNFGGGASQSSVIAALEFSMDPNGDLDINDKLDVVNLSLGSNYGTVHSLYNVAVKNVTDAGLLVVAAAGNDGPIPNIVGSPSTVDDALSVAAVRDNMRHHIELNAAKFIFENGEETVTQAIEGAVTTKLEELNSAEGKLVYIGDASVDLSLEQKSALEGNVALIDRGAVSFIEKIIRAIDAKATAVVMVNNSEDDPIVMGGEVEAPLSIPSVMITKAAGDKIKASLQNNSNVQVNLKPDEKYITEELIGTITDFSSQGPRSLDAGIKPEVAAPGMQIISAQLGTGEEGVKLNGTSMASPHVAGAAALLIQYRKDLNPRQIKSLIMNSSSTVKDENDNRYPVSRQGAGLLDVYKAAIKKVSFTPQAISLGKVGVGTEKQITKTIKIENISDKSAVYDFRVDAAASMRVDFSQDFISLKAGEVGQIELTFTISTENVELSEADVFIEILESNTVVGNIPVLAVISRETSIKVQELRLEPPSSELSDHSGQNEVNVSLINTGEHDGEALFFNLLGEDDRKPSPGPLESYKSTACDLQSAGYKIIERPAAPDSQEESSRYLQVAAKLYKPVSGWERCVVTVEIDFNSDGVSDKEMIGITPREVSGLDANPNLLNLGLSTLVFNSETLRQIDAAYEAEVAKQNDDDVTIDYLPALEGVHQITAYKTSTLAILEIRLPEEYQNQARLRVSTSDNLRSSVETEDILGKDGETWKPVGLVPEKTGYSNLPETVFIEKNKSLNLTFDKENSKNDNLVVYYPRNPFSRSNLEIDKQSEILTKIEN